MKQLDLFAAESPSASWMDAETWEYLPGLPDRSGLATYTHLIRSPHDGERESREARQQRLGVAHGAVEWKRLQRGKVRDWMEAIEGLLRDGDPRTFNRIVLELTDGAMTADTAHGKDPDAALWKLVEDGVLWWTPQVPIHFLHRDFVTPCACESCTTMEAA
jgi:hypothetical protein